MGFRRGDQVGAPPRLRDVGPLGRRSGQKVGSAAGPRVRGAPRLEDVPRRHMRRRLPGRLCRRRAHWQVRPGRLPHGGRRGRGQAKGRLDARRGAGALRLRGHYRDQGAADAAHGQETSAASSHEARRPRTRRRNDVDETSVFAGPGPPLGTTRRPWRARLGSASTRRTCARRSTTARRSTRRQAIRSPSPPTAASASSSRRRGRLQRRPKRL
mmetsp:Transcript_12337/g.43626  ORF Transcript_12337/g.43626 Transcript_12337/m.43626 type:complete len:213 (-) Transcript_12337:156-794(-)